MKIIFPQVLLIYNRRKTATVNKKASVELRITYNYKQRYISTGIMLLPKQWKNGRVVNCSNAIQLNASLDQMMSEAQNILLDKFSKGKFNLKEAIDAINKKEESVVTFLSFCKDRAEVRKYGKAEDSQERYDRFIKYFSLWGGIVYFEDVNEKNIIRYDTYLIKKGLKTYSKWNNYHRFLNSFICDAINEGLLTVNPYKRLNIEKGKDIHSYERHLTPEEFKRIKESVPSSKKLERVRDLFIFQTYTCLSYTDLRKFDSDRIQEIKDMRVYIGNRQKTGKTYTIPLLPEAMAVLEKYDYALPIISNVKYNSYLKELANEVGINRSVSTHWARHTGATLLLNEGVDMKIISKICGHSSTRITEQVYAKLLDETVVDAISKLQKNKTSHLHRQEEN